MARQLKEGPDQGWSWIIAFASCFTTSIIIGMYRMFGLLLVILVKEFNITRENASWPLITYLILSKIIGIIAGPLAHRFGIRPISILGSLIGAVGIALCFAFTTLPAIIFCFGVIFGIGGGLVYIMIPVAINQHFVKYRSTAMGIAFSGSGCGSFILPCLHDYFITYGLSGYFLLLSGTVLHLVVASALMRPPAWTEQKNNLTKSELNKKCIPSICLKQLTSEKSSPIEKPVIYRSTQSYSYRRSQYSNNTNDCNASSIGGSKILFPNEGISDKYTLENYELSSDRTTENYLNTERMREQSIVVLNNTNPDNLLGHFYKNLADDLGKNPTDNISSHQSSKYEKTCTTDNIEASNPVEITTLTADNAKSKIKILNCNQTENKIYTECPTSGVYYDCNKVSENTFNVVCLDETYSSDKDKKTPLQMADENCELNSSEKGIREQPHKLLGMQQILKTVMTTPMFYIITASFGGFIACIMMYSVTIIDYMLDTGVADKDVKYALFAFGTADLIGRLGFGWVTDRKFVQRRHFVMIISTAIAITFFSYPFAYGYTTHTSFAFIYGLLQGCIFVVYPILVIEYMGREMQVIAMGCMNFFHGLATIIWPFVIGYFRDHLGSYSNMYYLLGAISLGSSLIWFFESCFTKHETRDEQQKKNDKH